MTNKGDVEAPGYKEFEKKVHGQSSKAAGMYLKSDWFFHGQLYVACSRVSTL